MICMQMFKHPANVHYNLESHVEAIIIYSNIFHIYY